jgi:hypothetical protein
VFSALKPPVSLTHVPDGGKKKMYIWSRTDACVQRLRRAREGRVRLSIVKLAAIGTLTLALVVGWNFIDMVAAGAGTPSPTTTTSAPFDQNIIVGSSDGDLATVSPAPDVPSPLGEISFYICGPTASPTPCTATTNLVITTQVVPSVSSPFSLGRSGPFTPSSTGWWCFAVYYLGDQYNSASSDTSTDGCLDVLPVTAFHITTTSLPSATVGVPYSAQLQATGGISPYKWSTPSQLPKGLVLHRYTGILSGTPRRGGNYVIVAQARTHKSKGHPVQTWRTGIPLTVS